MLSCNLLHAFSVFPDTKNYVYKNYVNEKDYVLLKTYIKKIYSRNIIPFMYFEKVLYLCILNDIFF